ncbi:MAG TPA: alpha-amylase [Methylosinus sp.]|jgi:hypothetical protein
MLKGTRAVSPEKVVTTTRWHVDPAKMLRGVPQNAFAATQTVALAYGVTKDLSVVATIGMAETNLDFLTFKGPSGATRLGPSYAGADSLTDATVSAIYRIYADPVHRVQLDLGMSFPSGDNQNSFTLLQADGTYLTSRAFYATQIGSGTFDIMLGAVYAGHLGKWSWGVSYRARLPLAANPQGYLYGDPHTFDGWGGCTWIPGLTTTLRVNASLQGPIRGYDPHRQQGARRQSRSLWQPAHRAVRRRDHRREVRRSRRCERRDRGRSKNWQAGMALRFKI